MSSKGFPSFSKRHTYKERNSEMLSKIIDFEIKITNVCKFL